MPALDQCHNQIVHALEKDGWVITYDPYILYIADKRRVYIDIYAQRLPNNGLQSIVVVEVKCFADERAELNDLYTAVGQYIAYRNWLKPLGNSDRLYLAVPLAAYESIFKRLAVDIVRENRVKMIVVNIEKEVIVQWLEW